MKLFIDFFLGICIFCLPPLKKGSRLIQLTSHLRIFLQTVIFQESSTSRPHQRTHFSPLLSWQSRWEHKCYRAHVNKQSCFWSGRVSRCCCHGEALSPVSNDDGFVLLCQMCLTRCQHVQTCSDYINPEFLYLFSFSLFHFQFVIEQKRDNDSLSAERRFSACTPWIVFILVFQWFSAAGGCAIVQTKTNPCCHSPAFSWQRLQ